MHVRVRHAVKRLGCFIAVVALGFGLESWGGLAGAAEIADLGTRPAGDDWPCFLGPTHDSRSGERGIIAPWPKGGPRRVWQRTLGTSYCMPVISRGRLFSFERRDDQAELHCLESETGKSLWRFAYPTDFEDPYGYDNGPRACPVVDEDRVYCYGAEGMLHCLSVLDGSLLWKFDTVAKLGVVPNFFGVGSVPLVEGELLIVSVGGSPPESQGQSLDHVVGNGTGIVAFDKRTGAIRYRLSNELASYASPVAQTIEGRRWCFAFQRGGLLAFDPVAGRQEFHFPWRAEILESVNASNPVVVGNEVLISETYGPGAALLRVKPGGYDVVWSDIDRPRNKSLQTHWNTPVEVDGYVYASSGRHTNNAELRCVEWRTGKVVWSEPGLGRASLLYVDGYLVVLCEYGELLLVRATPEKFDLVSMAVLTDAAAGEQSPPASVLPGSGPRPLLAYPAWAAPIVSHGLLYVRGRDRLVCLEAIPSR